MSKVKLGRTVEREIQARQVREINEVVISDVRIDYRQHRITAHVDQLDEEIVLWQGDTAADLKGVGAVGAILPAIESRLKAVLEGDLATK